MPDLRTGSVQPVKSGTEPQGQSITKLPETNYQRWYSRIVSAFGKIGKKFRGRGYLRHKLADTVGVFTSHHQVGVQHFNSDYRRSLYDYKVAASMQLHDLATIREVEHDSEKEIVVGVGKYRSTKESLDTLNNTLKFTSVELCYRFLGEGKQLPAEFLTRSLLPHFEDLVDSNPNFEKLMASDPHLKALIANSPAEKTKAEIFIESIAHDVGLQRNADVTFERLLELKNAIRWRFESITTTESTPETVHAHKSPVNLDNPATSPPLLETPRKSRYQLDNEDKNYIKESVDKGGSLKIPKHDLRNRLKRALLRNKRNIVLNNLGIIISTVVTAVATGGIAAAVNVAIYIGWFAAMNGVGEAIKMAKVVKAMQKMEKSADFALNPTDMEAFKELDDDKFRTFMKACRYVCSVETLSRIYNDYAELENDVENSIKRSKAPILTASDAIAFEESKARYHYRKKNLDTSFELFNRLYTGAIGDMKRMEKEWNQGAQELWEHKFNHMSPKLRSKLFNKAASDPRVLGDQYHFETDQADWLAEVFPQMEDGQEVSDIKRRQRARMVDEALSSPSGYDHLSSDGKVTFSKRPNKVTSAVDLIKRGIKSYIYGWGKVAAQTTATHGTKIGWHSVENAPYLQISPQFPKPSVDGLVIFGFFFVADLLLDQLNHGVNSSRLNQIKHGHEGYTGPTNRERTGREEIGTLRSLTKKELPSFIDTLLSFHDAHKDIMEEMDYHKHLNKVDPYSPPFSHMDDYEAAVLVLRRKYQEQLMAKKAAGAIGDFYHQVQSKSDHLSKRMTTVIVG
ncbi:hypothetical protein ACH42_08340 [Endozoicomonas sp. (ex Bugula neritina AB1)]|nr:hypothetical protein ACH42_08340 [Endozoicomonas sp. (ex Bugula neritina AB1)]